MLKNIAKNFIYLSIFLIPFYVIRFSVGGIPTTILEVSIYLAFAVNLMAGNLKGVFKLKIFKIALAFVLVSTIGVFVDPDKLSALGLFKAYFFDGLLFFALILSLNDKEKERATNALIITTSIVSLILLAQYCFGIRTVDGRLLDLDRLSPNYIAMFLVPVLIISSGKAIQNYKNKFFYHYLIASVLIIVCIVLTDSRGAFVSLLGGAIVLFYFYLAKRFSKKVARYFLISSFLILFLGTLVVFRPVFSDLGRTGSSSNIRYYIWTTSIEMIRDNPLLGIGLSNYQDYFTDFTADRINYPEFISPQALTAHNLFLHIYLSASVFSLLAIIVLIVYNLVYSRNKIIQAALVALIVYSMIDTTFYRNDLSILFWLILALNL